MQHKIQEATTELYPCGEAFTKCFRALIASGLIEKKETVHGHKLPSRKSFSLPSGMASPTSSPTSPSSLAGPLFHSPVIFQGRLVLAQATNTESYL